MLRERLDACRKSEVLATQRAKRAREATSSALASRGSFASRLHQAAMMAGRHSCEAVEIGREPQVKEWAERHRRERFGYSNFDDED
jgi:hypothetical protein